MTANRSVDELNLRLAAIQDALLDLSPGPSPERYVLLKEQDALRAEAAAHHISADEQRSTDELEAELASLKQQRRRIVDAGTGFATGKGGSNQGPAAGAWVQLGTQARRGGDIGRLNARIARLEDLLAARHH